MPLYFCFLCVRVPLAYYADLQCWPVQIDNQDQINRSVKGSISLSTSTAEGSYEKPNHNSNWRGQHRYPVRNLFHSSTTDRKWPSSLTSSLGEGGSISGTFAFWCLSRLHAMCGEKLSASTWNKTLGSLECTVLSFTSNRDGEVCRFVITSQVNANHTPVRLSTLGNWTE